MSSRIHGASFPRSAQMGATSTEQAPGATQRVSGIDRVEEGGSARWSVEAARSRPSSRLDGGWGSSPAPTLTDPTFRHASSAMRIRRYVAYVFGPTWRSRIETMVGLIIMLLAYAGILR